MNIIEINYKKLRDSVTEYILANSENAFTDPNVHINLVRPTILMNEETLKFLNIVNDSKNNFSTLFGCNIAIANWLLFGEVELK